ncbi:MAG: tryptophan--tRNA ligase [Candidatus Methylacidiphilales bacterium]
MRYLSGIQPSGTLHLGNYFGMMRPAISLQERGEAFYFIADYHAQTSLTPGMDLPKLVREVALDFLACGLDPSRTVFFRQSAVPEVHELAWYLSTVCPMGLLERCHSFKDKTARGLAANHALFAYPVLMAADILLYDADQVPVGRDQKQHLEVARDLAQKFNDRYGTVFRLPEPVIQEEVATLPGIDGQKMSKSYGNAIDLFADEKAFRKRVMAIKTDSTPVEAPKPVENSILLTLAACVAPPEEVEAMKASMLAGGKGYGDYKKQLADWLWDYFEPFREKRAELAEKPGRVEEILAEGGVRARAAAERVLTRVRAAVGMG